MQTKSQSTIKILVIMASIVVILAGIKAATAIVVPFLLSVFIAMACSPIIT